MRDLSVSVHHLRDLPKDGSEVAQRLFDEIGRVMEEIFLAEKTLRSLHEEIAQLNAECEAERKRYRDHFDFCPDAYVVTTTDGAVLEANLTASKMFGVRREFIEGKPMLLFVWKNDRVAAQQRLRDLIQAVPRSSHLAVQVIMLLRT